MENLVKHILCSLIPPNFVGIKKWAYKGKGNGIRVSLLSLLY